MATDQDDEVTRLVVLDSVEGAIPAIERGEAELVVRDEDREDERDVVLRRVRRKVITDVSRPNRVGLPR